MRSHSSADSATGLRRDLDRLKSDIQQVGGDLSTVTKDAVDVARAGAAAVKEQLGDQLQNAGRKGKESVEAVRAQVSSNPLVSVAAAFAVGALIGFTFSRRS